MAKGQKQPMACFWMTQNLRIVSAFLKNSFKKYMWYRDHKCIAKSKIFTIWPLKIKFADPWFRSPTLSQLSIHGWSPLRSAELPLPTASRVNVNVCNVFAVLLWQKLSDKNENIHSPYPHEAHILVREIENYWIMTRTNTQIQIGINVMNGNIGDWRFENGKRVFVKVTEANWEWNE